MLGLGDERSCSLGGPRPGAAPTVPPLVPGPLPPLHFCASPAPHDAGNRDKPVCSCSQCNTTPFNHLAYGNCALPQCPCFPWGTGIVYDTPQCRCARKYFLFLFTSLTVFLLLPIMDLRSTSREVAKIILNDLRGISQ